MTFKRNAQPNWGRCRKKVAGSKQIEIRNKNLGKKNGDQ